MKLLLDELRSLRAEWNVRRFPTPHPLAAWPPADLREMIFDVIAELQLLKGLSLV
jgi:hypothetical protein